MSTTIFKLSAAAGYTGFTPGLALESLNVQCGMSTNLLSKAAVCGLGPTGYNVSKTCAYLAVN